MFRLKPKGLPADPWFPPNLNELGYFINKDDQIRNKQFPSDTYPYHINKNMRYNDVFREAFNQSVRTEVLQRLSGLNIKPLYLPQLETEKPANAASLPILTTPPARLRKCTQIIVINNACSEDLGIWSYRTACTTGTVNSGCIVDLMKEIISRCPSRDDIPGFIILNPGQLLYSYQANRAMSIKSWDAQPRTSAQHGSAIVHPANAIPENKHPADHLEFVFDKIVDNEDFVSKAAQIYCIARDDGVELLTNFLEENWSRYATRVMSLAVAEPGAVDPQNAAFAKFLRERSMCWTVSNHPLDTPLANALEENSTVPLPVRSGGVQQWAENVIPMAYTKILNYFEDVGTSIKRHGLYRNPSMKIPEAVTKELEEAAAQRNVPPATWGDDEDFVEQGEDIHIAVLGESNSRTAAAGESAVKA